MNEKIDLNLVDSDEPTLPPCLITLNYFLVLVTHL